MTSKVAVAVRAPPSVTVSVMVAVPKRFASGVTVTVRALATRELSSGNTRRIIRRELFVGLLNGLVFATILGTVAAFWFNVTDLGFVMALAMVTVLAAAALGGILIPLILTRLGVDPAVSSGPFVTTITDVVGFLSFLGIATLWFGLR